MSEQQITTEQRAFVLGVLDEAANGARVMKSLCQQAIAADGEERVYLVDAADTVAMRIGYMCDMALKQMGSAQTYGGAEDWLLSPRMLADIETETLAVKQA